MSFSFKKEGEINLDFLGERMVVLKDKIALFSGENIYFINQEGEILFSIPIFGFEKEKISEFIDLETDGNDIFILGKNKVVRYNLCGEFLNQFEVNLPAPNFIRISFPFGIFIFDKFLHKVKRYDFEGKEKGEFFVKKDRIKDMEIGENYIYFYYENSNVLVYNFYGNRVKEFKLIPGDKIEVTDNLIFILKGGNLIVFENNKKIYSENTEAKDFFIQDEDLYILSKNVEVRRIKR